MMRKNEMNIKKWAIVLWWIVTIIFTMLVNVMAWMNDMGLGGMITFITLVIFGVYLFLSEGNNEL